MATLSIVARGLAVALTVVFVLVATIACGDDDQVATPAPTIAGGDGGGDAPGEETEKFEVSMGDNFFEPSDINVNGGVIVEINLINEGAAIHNMRIGGADKQYNTVDDAVSDPPLVNGGEDATLAWRTPSLGGTFVFRCDFHPDTMVGQIVVERAEGQADAGTEGP